MPYAEHISQLACCAYILRRLPLYVTLPAATALKSSSFKKSYSHLAATVVPVRHSQRKVPDAPSWHRFSLLEVNEDEKRTNRPQRRPQRKVRSSDLPRRHRYRSQFWFPHQKRKRETFNPLPLIAHPATLTCEGCSQKSWHSSPIGAGEAERASWRPAEEADGKQCNSPYDQDETHSQIYVLSVSNSISVSSS